MLPTDANSAPYAGQGGALLTSLTPSPLMTSLESSRIVRKAARDFGRVYTDEAAELLELITMFEHSSIPASEAVLLLADLEIHRRRLMRQVRACATQLRGAVAAAPATAGEGSARRAA